MIFGVVVSAVAAALVIIAESYRPATSTAHGPVTVLMKWMDGKEDYGLNATSRLGTS